MISERVFQVIGTICAEAGGGAGGVGRNTACPRNHNNAFLLETENAKG